LSTSPSERRWAMATVASGDEETATKPLGRRERLKSWFDWVWGVSDDVEDTATDLAEWAKVDPEIIANPEKMSVEQAEKLLAGNALKDSDDFFMTREEKERQDMLQATVRTVALRITKQARWAKWRAWAGIVLGVVALSYTVNYLALEALEQTAASFHLSEAQIDEVADKLLEVEKQLRYDEVMGRIPMMTPEELTEKLKDIGEELEEEVLHEQLQTYANEISDILVGSLVIFGVIYNKEKIQEFFSDVTRQWMTLSNTLQAFTLLLVSDTLVGYHSADGWDAVLKMLGGHYGIHESAPFESFIKIFVATVPVGLDVAFKFWVFRELRRLSPSTQVILSEIED